MDRISQAVLFTLALATTAGAQSLGSVATADATVSVPGHMLESVQARYTLPASSSIVAGDRNAPVSLTRGGGLLLCRTSSLHLAGSADTLLLGLDRGALEIRTKATANDAILTPDLRITTAAGGQLDLHMRVSSNGDTCIENRGHKAPTLLLRDTFGEASYQVRPNQHVLFEHGSLKAVVDRETTPCGCPPNDSDAPRAVPLAEAILHGNDAHVTPQQAAAANPFPAAQSEGLAPAPALPSDKLGETHSQVAATIAYNPAVAGPPQTTTADAPTQPAPAPVQTPSQGGPFRAVGRFFKRIFVR